MIFKPLSLFQKLEFLPHRGRLVPFLLWGVALTLVLSLCLRESKVALP
jgi:hypothetical protein